MAWNGYPQGGSQPGRHPRDPDAWWDFVRSMNPNSRAGFGVDRAASAPAHGFAFGPDGCEAWSGRWGDFHGGWGRLGRHDSWPWAAAWDGPGASPWGEGEGEGEGLERGGRCRRRDRRHDRFSEEEPSGDETMRDAPTGGAAAGHHDPEKDSSPDTLRPKDDDGNDDVSDPPEEIPLPGPDMGRPGETEFGRGRRGRHHHPSGHVFPGCRGHHGHRGHHGRHGHHGHHGPHAPAPSWGPHTPNPSPPGRPFDLGPLMDCARRIIATHLHETRRSQQNQGVYKQAAARGTADDHVNDGSAVADDDSGGANTNTFVPPVDVFQTADNWTVHVALPGAKKADIALNWDAHKGQLVITGVVHRPGDETFLAGMVSGERRVGLFERRVALPPPAVSEDQDEVDGEGITARMEDGILVVVVPKAEKEEWTEVRQVDIE